LASFSFYTKIEKEKKEGKEGDSWGGGESEEESVNVR